MTIVKTPLQRVVTIAIGPEGVTHAWQQTSFVVTEDGVEISRGTSAQENLEPADIGAAVPQAGVLAQLNALQAAADAAAVSAGEKLAAVEVAAEATRADLQGKLDAANGKLSALTSHVGEAAKVLSAV